MRNLKRLFFTRLMCVLSQIKQNLKIRKKRFFFIFIVRTFSLSLWSAILATAAVCFVCSGAVSRNWYLQMPGIHHNCFRSVLLWQCFVWRARHLMPENWEGFSVKEVKESKNRWIICRLSRAPRGGTLTKFYMIRLRLEFQPLTLLYTILTEKVPV